jgi:hypothetical protein
MPFLGVGLRAFRTSLHAGWRRLQKSYDSKELGSGYSNSSGSKQTLGCSHGAIPQCFQTLPRSLHTYDIVGSYGNHVIWLAWGDGLLTSLAVKTSSQKVGSGGWILCQLHDWCFVINDNSTHFSTQKIEPLSTMLFVAWVTCKITSDPLLLYEHLLWKPATQTMWHGVPRLISHDFLCCSCPHHNPDPNKRLFFKMMLFSKKRRVTKFISSFRLVFHTGAASVSTNPHTGFNACEKCRLTFRVELSVCCQGYQL